MAKQLRWPPYIQFKGLSPTLMALAGICTQIKMCEGLKGISAQGESEGSDDWKALKHIFIWLQMPNKAISRVLKHFKMLVKLKQSWCIWIPAKMRHQALKPNAGYLKPAAFIAASFSVIRVIDQH